MKKLLLIPALMLSSALVANDYEITPVIGYNIAEGNINIKDQVLVGAEFQYNGFNAIASPELSVVYTNADYENGYTGSTNIYRVALNAVHEHGEVFGIIPTGKFGIGYESLSTSKSQNDNSPFINIGIGAKVPFTDALALKLEAVHMIKHNDGRYDNNLALLAGLNYAFGATPAKAAPVAAVAPVEEEIALVKEEVAPIVEEPTPIQETATVAIVDGDDDNDGVLNSIDKCPNTPKDVTKVGADGCIAEVNLHINFENASYEVDEQSYSNIQRFVDFLKATPHYTAEIVGHTDSVGRESSNQKLSQNRADAVKEMIIERGISSDRVSATGMGEANPIETNDTAEGRAQNRRIEAKLTKN
ncbi:MAG: OmpA family protein [Campylobacterota bacterium]|nr:OmpA family protein [Campylobacterota bacterium]